jgi:23S rRNA pseudouridine1911/1915/1917 synthase
VTGTLQDFAVTEAGRLDRVVAGALPELSRSQARRLIENGRITVDGATITKVAHAVSVGATIEVELPVVPNLDLIARDVPLSIIFEDEETLVIDKAPGMIIHPAPGVQGVTLINVVRARYPAIAEIDESNRPGVVHRLDRDTSGAMVFAKSSTAAQVLRDQWRERETLKLYLAIVEGRVDPIEGIIESEIGPDPANPRRRAVIENGQSARSQYRVLEQYGDDAALVEVQIYTGRTHQIRVHMAAIGYSVIGDTLYGHGSELIERQALHASRLGFTLATTGEWREFEAPLPRDMIDVIVGLRKRYHTALAPEIGELP